jgi:hypothetical protein
VGHAGVIAALLRERLGESVVANNLSIVFRDSAARSKAGIREALSLLAAGGSPTGKDLFRVAPGLARTRLSKLQPCLPERLDTAYVVDQLVDVLSASQLVQNLSIPLA